MKPIKRRAFRQGRVFTRRYMKLYIRKYLLKYLKKNNKLASSSPGEVNIVWVREVQEGLAEELVHLLTREEKATIESLTLTINTYLAQPDNLGTSRNAKLVRDLAEFSLGLGTCVDTNIGLSHSKVREYWLRRGPRQLWVYVFMCLFTLGVAELRGFPTNEDRIYTVVVGFVALCVGVFMLYYRLPDSLDGSIMRSAHDYYVRRKVVLRRRGMDLWEEEVALTKEAEGSAGTDGDGRGAGDVELGEVKMAIENDKKPANEAAGDFALIVTQASPPAKPSKPGNDRKDCWGEETESEQASGVSGLLFGSASPKISRNKNKTSSKKRKGGGKPGEIIDRQGSGDGAWTTDEEGKGNDIV